MELFEATRTIHRYSSDIQGFVTWLSARLAISTPKIKEPHWEGKEKGRSPESVISTLLVRLSRYGKGYSRVAIQGSVFSTQDEFVYLILLKAFGPMTKMELIKRNVQDKPTGIQIINRLLHRGWIDQAVSTTDKRSRIISINSKGEHLLSLQMTRIRQASQIVTGPLTYEEKMELIRLLNKLDTFHQAIDEEHIESDQLLDLITSRISSDVMSKGN